MSAILIIFGLAVLVTPVPLPDWMTILGGASFGAAATYKLFKRLELSLRRIAP